MESEETNDVAVAEAEEAETPEAELTAETDWEAEAKKARGIAQRLRTKLTKATERKKEGAEPVKSEPKTGSLDETALDYLDLKGISESEDLSVIESIIKKTGMTVREALKDEYVANKLKANKEAREVKDATPSSTKRSGSQPDTLERAVAKYEQSGFKELPDDFELRVAVVNAVTAKTNSNKPSWR